MAYVPVTHRGEIYFYYDSAEHWMNDGWKRFMVDVMIDGAWKWRRWGIDPPVGCDHSMSWQLAFLAMMPLWYALALELSRLLP